MSGTFQLGGSLFPRDPLTKRWSAERVGTAGTRLPIYTAIWRLECDFGTLETSGEWDFFESRFLQDGSYVAVLPHPVTSLLTQFTGTTLESVDGQFNDVDHNFFVEDVRVVFGVDIQATGTA